MHNSRINTTRTGALAALPAIALLAVLAISAALAAPDSSGRQVLGVGSCAAAAVQQAINDAPDGAIVELPAGNCDWGSTAVTYARDRSIWLRGAGIGNTVIRRTGASGNSFALTFDCSQANRVELSDITFIGRHTSTLDGGVRLTNSCRDFKLHDLHLSGFTASALEVRDTSFGTAPYSRGVVYDSRFDSCFNPGSPSNGEGYGIVVYGSHNVVPLDLGSAEAVFIEDNHFEENRHSIASNYGSRYVARHNTLITTNTTRNTSMIDAHGRQNGSDRGSRSWEVYQNHLIYRGDQYWADGIAMRGGDGVIWGNLIDFDGDTEIGIAYSAQLVIEEPQCPDYPGDGQPPAQVPGSPYPVPDQTTQAWIWDNTHVWADGNANGYDELRVTDYGGWDCRFYIQEDRDYHLGPKPGYQPYTYPHPLRGSTDTIFADGFD